MRDQYYRTGHGFIIVFSVVDHNSFDAVKPFITDITRVKDKNRYPIVICANKVCCVWVSLTHTLLSSTSFAFMLSVRLFAVNKDFSLYRFLFAMK